MKNQDGRGRVWATILYTESCASDYLSIIESWHVQSLLSPLHDKDLKEDGEKKKPHYHLMIWFEGKKSRNQVQELFLTIGGVGCERVESKIGMARYLCHLDNPDKVKYDVSCVIQFSGADYFTIITSDVDRLQMLMEMEQFCDDNDIVIYATLSRFARDSRPDWYRVLSSSATIHMSAYLKSRQYEKKILIEKEKEEHNKLYEESRNKFIQQMKGK